MGIVSWLVIIPFITAMVILAVPNRKWKAIRWIALAGTGTHIILTSIVAYLYWQAAVVDVAKMKSAMFTKLYLVERVTWFKSLGISYLVGLDGISLAMIILTSIIIFAGVLASWYVQERTKEFFVMLLVLVTGVFGVFVSFDLFLFFVFYEVAVLPMYLLIGIWGTGRKEYSAMKLTLMLLAGSAFLLVGILALYHSSGMKTFDILALSHHTFPLAFQRWVFPLIFVGFGVIGAMYPFHTWSPDGHASAPTAVSMLHAGVLMKLGGYGILRIGIYLLPQGAQMWGLTFLVLATVNITYGALAAVVQKDLKYFTAYSSVSHCGFILFGISTLTLAGLKGAVIQMFSHGIMTGLFFALIGMVYGRTHTRMMDEMGGLAKKLPWLATAFYIGGLASLGLPGFSGFIAETHVFVGGFFGNPWYNVTLTRVLTIIATLSIVITAVYVLRGLAKVFHGPITNPHFEKLKDATLPERFSTGILIVTLAFVGILPWFFIDLIEGAILPLFNRLYSASVFTILN